MAFTKEHLAEEIRKKNGFSRKKSFEMVEALLKIFKTTLQSGEDVMISGFGKFSVKEKKARQGRNPSTGKPLELKARRIVRFKYSEGLKNRVNSE